MVENPIVAPIGSRVPELFSEIRQIYEQYKRGRYLYLYTTEIAGEELKV